MKFYTEEGNWDLVGNNTPVFFIRDPLKFGDFIHTQKREPGSNLKSATMMWDFWSLSPESLHQVTILFSDRGIPDGYRHMNGYGSHTFSLINAAGELHYCKWHFITNQGIKNLPAEEAEILAGAIPTTPSATSPTPSSAASFPSWSVKIQVMPESEIDKPSFDPFDLTKVWPHGQYPLIDVGVLTLDRMPDNYFAETEQAAFNPSNVIPGLGYSPDKMLQGRLLSYPDAHRYRIGTNYDLLPINARKNAGANYNRDGSMRFDGNYGSAPNYEPNSFGGPAQDAQYTERPYTTAKTVEKIGRYNHREGNDDYTQAGNLWRLFSEGEKNRTARAIAELPRPDPAAHPEAAALALQAGRPGLRTPHRQGSPHRRAPRVPQPRRRRGARARRTPRRKINLNATQRNANSEGCRKGSPRCLQERTQPDAILFP